MPAPVRYRPTAAAYVAGGADVGTTRTRGSRNPPQVAMVAVGAPPQ